MVRTVVAEDACPVGGECYGSGLIHLYDNVGGALYGGGYWEGLVLPCVYDRIKCVGSIHCEGVWLRSVLYVAVVDDDTVAFVDRDAVRSKSVVRNAPCMFVEGQGTVEEVESSGGRCGVVNRIADACPHGGACGNRYYANDEEQLFSGPLCCDRLRHAFRLQFPQSKRFVMVSVTNMARVYSQLMEDLEGPCTLSTKLARCVAISQRESDDSALVGELRR